MLHHKLDLDLHPHVLFMAAPRIVKRKDFLKIKHDTPLFERRCYKVGVHGPLCPNPMYYDPHKYKEDYKLAFKYCLEFWVWKHRSSGTFFEYEIVDRKKKGIVGYCETFNVLHIRRVARFVTDFEGVLDCHLSLQEEFSRIHPKAKVWFYKEADPGSNAWYWDMDPAWKLDCENW